MAEMPKDSDRTVHAVCEDGREIVRYDRGGKWWIECFDGKRRAVSLAEAVAVAAEAHVGRGQIYFGKPGGKIFDKRARDRFDEIVHSRRTA